MQKQLTSTQILCGILVLILVATCVAIIILSINVQYAIEIAESNTQMEEYSITLEDENVANIYLHIGNDHFFAKSYKQYKDGTAIALEVNGEIHRINNARDVEVIIYYTE